ncbi:hypothetical protein MMC14_006869 [Varicellaria rhodocarpa]|nr:hypothetical protein [Varicellaria rhodocarpa]
MHFSTTFSLLTLLLLTTTVFAYPPRYTRNRSQWHTRDTNLDQQKVKRDVENEMHIVRNTAEKAGIPIQVKTGRSSDREVHAVLDLVRWRQNELYHETLGKERYGGKGSTLMQSTMEGAVNGKAK